MRVLAVFAFLLAARLDAAPPNVLWIIVEDQSPHYGPYGETLAKTPNVDRLAREGVTFENAFVTAPVCSPARSAIITGMYQTTIGSHNHRSGRGAIPIHLPEHVRTIPDRMRHAGYYVTNGRFKGLDSNELVRGKTDYNFVYGDLYDAPEWSGRADDQPFFAQIQLRGGKNRDQKGLSDRPGVHTNGIDPAKVTIPPYYPDTPEIRADWAQYLESIEHVDWVVGQILDRLQRDGDLDNTLIFFLTDHGVSHARGKQFVYEEGIRIPLIVRGPGIPRGERRQDLVAHIDVSASTLAAAGMAIPGAMEGRPLFGPGARPREYVVSARDRCDETVEQLRSVRTARFKYIRNGYPARPHLQPNRYKDGKTVIRAIRELHARGKLDKHQRRLFGPRPAEELYDLEADPNELTNLAKNKKFTTELERHRRLLRTWIATSGDRGQQPETEAVYDADMAVYMGSRDNEQAAILKKNIAQMKLWASEGK